MDIIPKTLEADKTDTPIVKRLVAEALRVASLREVFAYSVQKNVIYAEYLALMVWDGMVDGKITFADGTTISVAEEGPRTWLDLVKYASSHMDGPVGISAQFNNVNIFKVYQGIDADKL
jgi:hypothetical protein